MWRIEVLGTCIASGSCTAIAPRHFVAGAGNRSTPIPAATIALLTGGYSPVMAASSRDAASTGLAREGGGPLAWGDGRDESPADRLDRNWNELLQELRVAQTGVQILSGFLLTVPFQQRFTQLSQDQRVLYLALVLAAALTTGLLIAPVSMHRMLFRRGEKARLVRLANLAARAGLLSLSLVVSGVLLLVFDVVAAPGLAWAVAITFFIATVTGWFLAPLLSTRGPTHR